MSKDLFSLLRHLPGSYTGATRTEPAPYAVVGSGEGSLAAGLLQPLVGGNLIRSGTQFILSSPDAATSTRVYAELAEVAGAQVRRIGTGGLAAEVDVLVPGGALSSYHFAQAVAYTTGHVEEAQEAERLLAGIAESCSSDGQEGNPARDLAWRLWERVPLLLAAPGAEVLPHAWQSLLARVAKTLSVPVLGDPLAVVTGAFESRHELGDGRVALILGDSDPLLTVAAEVLETRVDEVIHVPCPLPTESDYASQLALWYFGAWVAAYLAERYQQPPEDTPVLHRAQAVLAGEAPEEDQPAMPLEEQEDADLDGE